MSCWWDSWTQLWQLARGPSWSARGLWDTRGWHSLQVCVFPKLSVIFSMLGETGSSPSTAVLHWGHPGSMLCFSGRCFLTSFASDEASFSIVHELHRMGINPMFTGLKTIQGLRKDLLSQSAAAVGITSPISCFLQRSYFNQGW